MGKRVWNKNFWTTRGITEEGCTRADSMMLLFLEGLRLEGGTGLAKRVFEEALWQVEQLPKFEETFQRKFRWNPLPEKE